MKLLYAQKVASDTQQNNYGKRKLPKFFRTRTWNLKAG